VLSNFEDTSHGRKFWQTAGAVTMRGTHVSARLDSAASATLDALAPLVYRQPPPEGLPPYVRSASALRRFGGGLVIVQDDVNAFAVGADRETLSPVLLPPHSSGQRVFDDARGNKHLKLDLEACVTLADGRLVVFGSGSMPAREHLVVWNGHDMPAVVPATPFYAVVRAAAQQGAARLNIEGAVIGGGFLQLFQRGNDAHGSRRTPHNAIVAVGEQEFVRWLDGGSVPSVVAVTSVELGERAGVAYGFTDAVALDDGRIVVLACAERSSSALTDGAVLGCRVGLLDDSELVMAEVRDAGGAPSTLKLEGIDRRPGARNEFDVVVDVDRPATPAQFGRLTLSLL
jgi:hypothetical protein